MCIQETLLEGGSATRLCRRSSPSVSGSSGPGQPTLALFGWVTRRLGMRVRVRAAGRTHCALDASRCTVLLPGHQGRDDYELNVYE